MGGPMTSDDRTYYVDYDGQYIGDVRANTWYLAREAAYCKLRSQGIVEVTESKLKLTVVDSRFPIG